MIKVSLMKIYPIGMSQKNNNIFLMFFGASSFNSDLSNWDVSNVTNMSAMFKLASSFNQDLSEWNVSNVLICSCFFSYEFI